MKILLSALLSILSTNSWAVKLSDYKPFSFEPLFTNPVCATYSYPGPVIAESGKTLTSKPQNVYCKPSDESASVSRPNSPQYKIIQWVLDRNTKSIYMAYLSFNSKNVARALCSAVGRGVQLSIVLDGGEEPAHPKLNPDAEGLKSCGAKGLVTITYRGSTQGLGYAHNKIMIMNPKHPVTGVLFSSGNMTGGTSINHENWNFVTTSGESFFAQAHVCAVEAMILAGDTKTNFAKSLNDCRGKIKAQPESDIRVYFAPVDGALAMEQVRQAANSSTLIEAMSHRFSGQMAELFKNLLASRKPIKFILDDDIYWSAKRREDIGRNTSIEASKIYKELINVGMNTKFLQTNQSVFQLQHNKFMIFTYANGSGAVFNGAGNFTTAAFTKNFENFYYITIPQVAQAYNKQYDLYYDKMATSAEDMPRDYVLP